MIALKHIVITSLTLLSGALLLGVNAAVAIEKAKYTVLEKEDDFEIRRYAPRILAETLVGGDIKAAGNEGFRRLYAYISGNNKKRQSVAMTAPVGQEKKGDQYRITFLMPVKYTLDNLPEPIDARVKLVKVPGRLMAAVRYSGTWSEKGYKKHKALLKEYIQRRSLKKAGPAVWARYDPPFMPWFLRRNEVLIPVQKF